MPLEGDAKREYNKNYNRRKKLGVDVPSQSGEQAVIDFQKCKELDEAGTRCLGEFHTYTQLCKIYYGADPNAEPDDKPDKKKKFVKCFAHEIVGKKRTFEEWLELRDKGRRDLWFLAETCGHKGLHEKAHRPIVDFFVKKDNTALPIEYTNEQLKQCLLEQDEQHERLLLYPRGFFKSTLMMVDGVQWVLNFPDIVLLSVSSTIKLSNSFVKEFRSYFSIKDFDNPSWNTPSGDFKLLYPDFCVAEGSGDKRSFQSPMARLDMRNPTLSASSVESSTAGHRAHIIKFDDTQDEHNYLTAEQRIKVRDTYDAIRELVIRPFGFIDVGGTRWTDGDITDDVVDNKSVAVPDLYGTIIKRNEESDDRDLKTLISPAWTVLPSGEGKPLKELVESDVDLLFPEGQGAFKILRKKLLENPTLFRCNQLNEPVAKIDSDVYVNHFTEALLTRCMIDSSHVPAIGKDYIFVDGANSIRKQADFSVLVAYRIVEDEGKDPVAYLRSVDYGHWTNSELAQHIVSFCKKWMPICTFIEELPTTSDLFKKGVQEQKRIQGTDDFYIQWFKPDPQAKAKEIRIKNLEVVASSGRWKICIGAGTNAAYWIDELKKQFIQFTGHAKTKGHIGGRHDDIPDCSAQVYKVMRMANWTASDKAAQDALKNKLESEKMSSMIFGSSGGFNIGTVTKASEWINRNQATPNEQVPVEEDYNPIYNALKPLQRN